MKFKLLVRVSLTFICFLLFTALYGSANQTYGKSDIEEHLDSPVYLLGEPNSGEILVSENEHEHVYPASITKIMTLLLVLEALEEEKITLEETVTVPREADNVPGTTIFLEQGEELTVEELLTAIAVGSANDASVALTKHISGTVENFVEKMNQRAKELGMKNTNFTNPHGLHEDNHYTTAKDIFIMASELGNYDQIHDRLSIWMIEDFLSDKKHVDEDKEGVFLSNTNRLINEYLGCDGYKTGYTEEALHSIAATAERDGERYIAIIMRNQTSDGRFEDAMGLLDYAFANYQIYPVFEKNEPVARVKVEKGKVDSVKLIAKKDLVVVLEKDEELDYEEQYQFPEQVTAPVEQGEELGNYSIKYSGKELSVALEADKSIEEAGIFDHFGKLLRYWTRLGSNAR